MKVILLAGGKGERLRPLTNMVPKPLVEVGGKPLVEYSIDLFKSYGFSDFTFTLCYLPQKIEEYFGNGKKHGIKCSYVTEDEKNPLGTAGAISGLANKLKETFIVCSGDILRESDIKKLLAFHKEKKGIATIGVYDNKKPDPKSIITFKKDGLIANFVERPRTLPKGKVWSNASIYVFEPRALTYIFNNRPCDFGKDVFPQMLKNGEKLYAFPQTGYFLDVGTLEKLEKAKKDLKEGVLSYEK